MEIIKTRKIKLTGWNPRKVFNEQAMSELQASIREHGILQPLVLRPTPKRKDEYQVVAGERRYRAALALELAEVPANVRFLDDRQVRELMLIENLQREDLEPLEEARALQQLLDKDHTQQQLADRLGVSQPWIAGRLRLLKAPQQLQGQLKYLVKILPLLLALLTVLRMKKKHKIVQLMKIVMEHKQEFVEKVVCGVLGENVKTCQMIIVLLAIVIIAVAAFWRQILLVLAILGLILLIVYIIRSGRFR